MGNNSSSGERASAGQGERPYQRDDGQGAKDGALPKILMDSTDDADLFNPREAKNVQKYR